MELTVRNALENLEYEPVTPVTISFARVIATMHTSIKVGKTSV